MRLHLLLLLPLVAWGALNEASAPAKGVEWMMPTRTDLEIAAKEIREDVEALLKDIRDGTRTRAEVADEVRIYAGQVPPAGEYLLLQGAFRLFMRAGEYARAVEMLRHMRDREFPPEALVSLAEQALKPVPRGVDVVGMDELLVALRDEIAQTRRQTDEWTLERAGESLPPRNLAWSRDQTVWDAVARFRSELSAVNGPRFNVFGVCPLEKDRVPSLPDLRLTNATPRAAFAAACAAGGFELRPRGRSFLLKRNAPRRPDESLVPSDKAFLPGDAEKTARRLKTCRLGFVAFDSSETLADAAERLFLAVQNRSRLDFDLLVLTPPSGSVPLSTVRAADITLYDALGLLCTTADASFQIRGSTVVIHPPLSGRE